MYCEGICNKECIESSNELKLKEVKLNELIVVDGYVYMFTRPNTPLVKTDDNGLVLITVELLKDAD